MRTDVERRNADALVIWFVIACSSDANDANRWVVGAAGVGGVCVASAVVKGAGIVAVAVADAVVVDCRVSALVDAFVIGAGVGAFAGAVAIVHIVGATGAAAVVRRDWWGVSEDGGAVAEVGGML